MIRRKFLGLMTIVGAGGLASLKAAKALDTQNAAYKVTGFTCITCAVGLETVLQRKRGIVRVNATYPEAIATITYNPGLISEQTIIQTIKDLGFQAQAINRS
ncbi:heavy-metal-associated domain-containing protein [Granulicella arctica]|uniref:heavy-metal-associated domain-containing protein n=1 Tax=Granulicella arctica TaxID=940613 RepID=UPI0021DF671E|nr:heavy metal-associated domain-containing protein [Granulicella arctica]